MVLLKGAICSAAIRAAISRLTTTAEFEGVDDETKTAKRARGETDRNRLEQRVQIGRQFRVTEGPFASFLAEVETLTHDDRVKALVNIFGRMTPVEFEPGSP